MNTEILATIVARLATVPVLKESCGGVEELEEAYKTPQAKLRTPSAYAILLGEVASPNEMVSIICQRVTVTFGVVLAIENTLNPRGIVGGGYKSRLQEIRALVMAKMINFQPTSDYEPVEYERGRLVSVEHGTLWWQEEFKTAYYLRSDAL